MRHLLLLRHAKSSWASDGIADRDRPLAPRGARDAANMAKAIADRGLLPDRILCSTARRTRETLAALHPYLAAETEAVLVEDIYSSPAHDYAGIIADSGDDASRLLVIGHNPRIHATAVALTGKGDKADRTRLAAKFPTGALAVIAFSDGGWEDIRAGAGRLETLVTPRDLDGEADDD